MSRYRSTLTNLASQIRSTPSIARHALAIQQTWCLRQYRRLPVIETDLVSITKHRGIDVVYDAFTNRGTSFSIEERERLGIRGLVPPSIQTLRNQMDRILISLNQLQDDLEKYSFLSQLFDRNVVLFYKILIEHFEQLAPIVYTPTVADAVKKSHLQYRRSRGMWFSAHDRGFMSSMTYNWPRDDIDVIVVTDGSRILGIGDQGSNGMQIPIGKLHLYVAGGGINPKRVLPCVLDVGTNNEELRMHPLYLGLRQRRLEGEDYYSFVEEFMAAVFNRWPHVLLQFEDFANPHASNLLNMYRNRYTCFNDDIQSTGCITLAAVLASLRARHLPFSAIKNERIVCVGAGSAGIGVCETIVRCMMDEGLTRQQALDNFWLTDQHGLLGAGRKPEKLLLGQEQFVRPDMSTGTALLDTIKRVKPSVLIGLSGVGGIFTEDVVSEMSKHVKRPVIFPLSNPSSSSEITAEQAFAWTRGTAIFASGSPFPDIRWEGGGVGRTNQCNNVYNFPGIGLAVTACRISRVTDEMFQAAARCIANLQPESKVKNGRLFPPLSDLRTVSVHVAEAVVKVALEQGFCDVTPRKGEDVQHFLRSKMYEPHYLPLVNKPSH